MDENDEMTLDERLAARRAEFETHILQWDGKKMWYQERWLQFPGICNIVTDELGVSVNLVSEHYERPLSLYGRWDYMMVYKDGMGAVYGGWSITEECAYPELGINTNQ